MNKKNNANVLKILIIFLGICLTGLLVYTYAIYRGSKENSKVLQQEKDQLNNELTKLQHNYNTLLDEHTTLSANFKKEKKRISQLKNALQESETNVKALRKFKVQVELLQMEKKRLMLANNNLLTQNKQLQTTIDSTSSVLASNKKRNDSLSMENQALAEKIAKAAILKISEVQVEALTGKNRKKVKPTDRARETDQIRVSFTISKNELIPPGEQKFYFQVINPNHNIVGKKSTVSFEQKVLNYSETDRFSYTGEKQKLHIDIDCHRENLIAGRYLVNIFKGPKLIGSTSLELQ